MCYHKQDKALKGSLEAHYDAILRDIDYKPTYYENGFDFKESPLLTAERPKELIMYRWGLVPWWTKSLEDGLRMRVQTLNCISEEMYEKSSFRDAAKENKRCLIPCTGFFEWRWDNVDKPKNKTPYFIHSKYQEIFSIGGLYSTWRDKKSDEELSTYTVLTTKANPFMSQIHNSKLRQPVLIKKEFEKDWLNPNLTENDVLELCMSMPEDFLVAHTISKNVSGNKLSTDEKNKPEITAEVTYTEEETAAPDKPSKKGKKKDSGQGSLF
jgi:putative SOS response-associated peptidase YedK